MATNQVSKDYRRFMSKYQPMIDTANIFLMQVSSARTKEIILEKIAIACNKCNFQYLTQILEALVKYSNKNAPSKKVKVKEPVYEVPPTFNQALVDFSHLWCNDLLDFPDLPEYFARTELSEFPDTAEWKKKRQRINHRQGKTINTIVKRDMVIASADTQSGKTKFMVCAALKGMTMGKTPVIVVRRITADANQMEKSCNNLGIQLKAFLDKHKVTDRKFEITVIRGDKLDQSNAQRDLRNSLTGQYLRIVVCLGNETQLKHVYDVVQQTKGSFNLFIDEIDSVDYGDSKASNVLASLKKSAYQVVGVTATPLDCIFSESDMKAANQLRLTLPDDYRGFTEIAFKLLEFDSVYCLNKVSTFKEICTADPNFKTFLKEYSLTSIDFAWKLKKYHPNICLIKNTRINENQNAIFEGIVQSYPTQFVTIAYNGFGIKLYHHKLPERFLITGVHMRPNVYSHVDIADVLQYLKDNGGYKKFPRIYIIAGELAGRCISYVTRDYDWHLTDMYYVPAATTSIPEMIQSVGRINGRNKYKAHRCVYAIKKVVDALCNGFNCTNELINRAIAQPLIENGSEKSFAESIKSVPLNKIKFPVGRKMTSKVKVLKRDFNLINGDDGGVPLKKYKYDVVKKEEKKEREEKVEVVEKIEVVIQGHTNILEFQRLMKMFPKWSKGSSKISTFMNNLDPLKIYTIREISDTGLNISDLTHSVNDSHRGYGIIMRKISNGYQLLPELVDLFKKYF
jgi:hypothetical protein